MSPGAPRGGPAGNGPPGLTTDVATHYVLIRTAEQRLESARQQAGRYPGYRTYQPLPTFYG